MFFLHYSLPWSPIHCHHLPSLSSIIYTITSFTKILTLITICPSLMELAITLPLQLLLPPCIRSSLGSRTGIVFNNCLHHYLFLYWWRNQFHHLNNWHCFSIETFVITAILLFLSVLFCREGVGVGVGGTTYVALSLPTIFSLDVYHAAKRN